MVEGDIFREVEEELRRERLKALWDKYGAWVLAGAVTIVAGVAGHQGWQYWSAQRAASSGAEYEAAVQLAEDGKSNESVVALEKLAESGPSGYRGLARFRLAAQLAGEGKTAEAAQIYEALSKDSGVDVVLQSFARIRAASLNLDTADFTATENQLNDLAGASNPWRNSAREIIGLAAFKAGKREKAEMLYNQIMGDPLAPQALRQRAQMMLSLLVNDAGGAERAGNDAKKAVGAEDQTN